MKTKIGWVGLGVTFVLVAGCSSAPGEDTASSRQDFNRPLPVLCQGLSLPQPQWWDGASQDSDTDDVWVAVATDTSSNAVVQNGYTWAPYIAVSQPISAPGGPPAHAFIKQLLWVPVFGGGVPPQGGPTYGQQNAEFFSCTHYECNYAYWNGGVPNINGGAPAVDPKGGGTRASPGNCLGCDWVPAAPWPAQLPCLDQGTIDAIHEFGASDSADGTPGSWCADVTQCIAEIPASTIIYRPGSGVQPHF